MLITSSTIFDNSTLTPGVGVLADYGMRRSTMVADGNLSRAILTRERVGAALGQLSMDEQAALALRFGEGLTAEEVGTIMGREASKVQSLQRQGLAALRLILTVGE